MAESPAANTRHRKQISQDTPVGLPPTKRARTKSNASGNPVIVANDGEDAAQLDPGEPSSTTKHSSSIEQKSKRRSSRTTSTKGRNGETKSEDSEETEEDDEGQLDDTERKMVAPGRAGLRDPIGGYKTNPPPTDRAVRVYADGVFDLFHLGYVQNA